jgi:hypothetical protein
MKLISNTTPKALGKRRNKRLPSLKEAFSLQQKQRRSQQPAPLLETEIEDWVIPAEYQQYEDGPDESNQYEEPASELEDGGGDADDFQVTTSWPAGQAPTLATTTEQLSAYHDRLQQFEGLSEAEATTVSTRMSKLVLWTWCKHGPCSAATDAFTWLSILFVHKYVLLRNYVTYLTTSYGLQWNTIKVWLRNIRTLIEWFMTTHYQRRLGAAPRMVDVYKLLKKLGTECHKNIKTARSEVTLITQIRDKRLPSGGLAELQGAVDSEMKWVARDRKHLELARDQSSHDRMLEVLFAALWVHSVNGRKSGVADMKFDQVDGLFDNGYAMSTKFKTAATYGFQPVCLPTNLHWLFRVYLAARASIVAVTHSQCTSLWLNFRGEHENRIGDLVTRLFKRVLSLHITTTKLRSLIETTADVACDRQLITPEQKQAVQWTNGHSADMVKQYYLLKDTTRNAVLSAEAFACMNATPPPAGDTHGFAAASEPEPNPEPNPAAHLAAAATMYPLPVSSTASTAYTAHTCTHWGRDHPNYGTTRHRASWSDAEIQYITEWYTRHAALTDSCNNQLASRCLKHIWADPQAYDIFHSIHTLDSGRLRVGVDKVLRLMQVSSL